jgi:hypothetical protein
MAEGPIPKNWGEATPAIVWLILIFAAGFEGIASLVHGEWVPCIASFALLAAMTAALLHWRRLTRWGPLSIAAAALLIVIAVSSPLLERLWPSSAAPQSATINITKILYGTNSPTSPSVIPHTEIGDVCDGEQICEYPLHWNTWDTKYGDPLKDSVKEIQVYFNCGAQSAGTHLSAKQPMPGKAVVFHFDCSDPKHPRQWATE